MSEPQDIPTPAPDDARGVNLAREAAKWRTQYREAQKELDQLKSQLAATSSGSSSTDPAAAPAAPLADGASPSPAAAADDPEYQELLELRTSAMRNLLHKQLSDAGAGDPAVVEDILRGRGVLVAGDDGTLAVLADGAPQPVSRELLDKLIPDALMKATGHSGSGSRAGRRVVAGGFNYERGLTDQAYFRAHKSEMTAEYKRRNGQ